MPPKSKPKQHANGNLPSLPQAVVVFRFVNLDSTNEHETVAQTKPAPDRFGRTIITILIFGIVLIAITHRLLFLAS